MNKLQMIGKRLKTQTVKNSPSIFTGLAVAGLLTTTVMAVKATPKALAILEAEKELRRDVFEDGDPDYISPIDMVKLTWKCYIPAGVMGCLTIGFMIGANSINLRRNAALASVYSISETALKEYQAKVVETIGEKKEQGIRDEIAKDKVRKSPVKDEEVVITGYGSTLCYDSLSGRYFRSDIEKIRQVFNELGRDMLSEMFISLNDIYYALGLNGTKMGDLVGWHIDDGLVEPHFSSQLTENGDPCLVLDYNIEPRYGVMS